MADDHDVSARGHDDQSSPMLCSRVKKCQSKPPSPKRVKYTLCGHCDTLVASKRTRSTTGCSTLKLPENGYLLMAH